MEVSGQLHAPAALPPREESPVGPKAGLDMVSRRRKIPNRRRESNPDHAEMTKRKVPFFVSQYQYPLITFAVLRKYFSVLIIVCFLPHQSEIRTNLMPAQS
jgi:hypothetical protein